MGLDYKEIVLIILYGNSKGLVYRGGFKMEEENKNIVEETTDETQQVEQEQTEKTTYDQAEVDRLISKQFEKWQKKAEKETAEATKLASMNAEEKARYEIEQSKKEIEQMKSEFVLQQNKSQCMEILADKGIDVTLADFVVAEDAETMKANIDKVEQAVKRSVEEEVNRRLKGTTPKRDVGMPAEINKETFSKMTLDQQQELYNTNKELYMQLIKQ